MNYVFQFGAVFAAWPRLLWGTWITIQLSPSRWCSAWWSPSSAPGQDHGAGPVRWLVNAYIELIRNTPFLVQLFFFFFALPALGLRWSHSGGADGDGREPRRLCHRDHPRRHRVHPEGQIEAGLALDLKPLQIFRYVVLSSRR